MSPNSSIDDDDYDSDEPPPLELNLDKLMERATEVFSAACVSAKRITRGTSHEIFVLQFLPAATEPPDSPPSSGFTCIARCARVRDIAVAAKEESEIATIRYLKKNTSIPVPHISYYNSDHENDVGAPFMLMERLPGRHLYQTWDQLPMDHKTTALSEIASLIVQLASLKFDKIGSLQLPTPELSSQENLGPVFSPCYESPQGPFLSTEDYLQSFVGTTSVQSSELRDKFQQIQTKISNFLAHQAAAYLQPPFALIHADFDAQNMLFSDTPKGPRLTGLVDFEFSFTGPPYFLYEYPIFIQDVDMEPGRYTENALLRARFVQQIFRQLPGRQAKSTFIACMNEKSFILNRFYECFMHMKCSEHTLLSLSTHYLKSLEDGTGLAHSGRMDYRLEVYVHGGRSADKSISLDSG